MTGAVANSARVVESVLDLVGATKLVRLKRVVPDGAAAVWAKMEYLNPGGSIADRAVFSLVEEAARTGALASGRVIVDAATGSTAVSLAIAASALGYKLVVVMPASASLECRAIVKAYGAELILTVAFEGFEGARREADRVRTQRGGWDPQLTFPTVETHQYERGLVREISDAMQGLTLDAVVVRRGATVDGLAHVLFELVPDVRVLTLEGSGDTTAAREMSSRLAKEEGLLVGFSSGANVLAAIDIARELGAGKNVVTFLEDTGERYFSLLGRPA